jgi:hypothetical protein
MYIIAAMKWDIHVRGTVPAIITIEAPDRETAEAAASQMVLEDLSFEGMAHVDADQIRRKLRGQTDGIRERARSKKR